MFHRIAFSLLVFVIAAPVFATDEKAKDHEGQIAAEIARLGNSNKSESAAAVEALVKMGSQRPPPITKP